MSIEICNMIIVDYEDENYICFKNSATRKESKINRDKNTTIIEQCLDFLSEKKLTVKGYHADPMTNKIYFFTNYYTTNN